MELMEAIKNRRSIRLFKNKKIPKKLLIELIKAAQYAPSGGNMQLWKFIIIQDQKIKNRLVNEAGSHIMIKKAPVAIAVFYLDNTTTDIWTDYMSASAAIQNMLLRAHELGLGACWIAYVGNKKKVKEILKAPKEAKLISFVAIGWPAINPKMPPRRPLKEIMCYNFYQFNNKNVALIRPSNWPTQEDLIKTKNLALRQTTGIRESFPYGTKSEFEKEIDTILTFIKDEEKLTFILPFDGTHMMHILEKKKNIKEAQAVEVCDNAIYFMKEREKYFNLKIRPHYLLGDIKRMKFPLKRNSARCCLCTQQLETLKDIKQVLNEVYRILEPQGKFIISFRNLQSWYGIYFCIKSTFKGKKYKPAWPWEPKAYSQIIKILNQMGFIIKREVGISPLPFARGIKVGEPFSKISKLVIVECVKIK